MIPLTLDDPSSGAVHVLGMPMNQNRLSVPTWSYAMEVYPPKRIIEFGSYNGGFTIALAVHAWNIGANVFSVDIMEAPSEEFRPLARFLGITFYKGDLFLFEDGLKDLIRCRGVTYLLCDGGDKPKEFQGFSKYLKHGDVIAAHDFHTPYWNCSEITLAEVAESVREHNLKPFMQEHFDCAGWLAFRKE